MDREPEDQPPTSSERSDNEKDSAEPAEEGVTMLDVLEEEEALEEDCAAVLGGFSDSSCTYSLGYVPRQPLYACRDCSKEELLAGICLGCSYQCHEGCSLVELYTKRNFRCDCGTNRMTSQCKLDPDKQENNNSYNQNFRGLYCTCSRPYPDPEDPVEDLMIQCVVCEDWFHGRHLAKDSEDSVCPPEGLYEEMICYQCVERFDFLKSYSGLAVRPVVQAEGDQEVRVEGGGSVGGADSPPAGECKLRPPTPDSPATSLFFPSKWRKSLCRCEVCTQMYADKKIAFLTDEEDTVQYYESRSREEKKGTLEHGMEALSQMDRVKQVEAIHSYNNMKMNLMEYLSKFADNKKVVREEDIREFFQGMTSNKKRRYDGAPPSSCK